MTALRIKTLADHGYTDAAANPSKFPAGLFSICTGSYDSQARLRRGRRRLHQQAAGRHRLSLLVPRHRGGARHRAHGRRAGARAEDGSRRAAHEELHPARAVSVQVGARLGVRQRQLCRRRCRRRWTRSATPICARSRPRSAQRGELMGIGISQLHRDRRRRPVEALRHPRHQDVRLVRDPRASDRQGDRALRHQVAGPGARDDLRADHRRGAGHSRSAHPGRGRRHRHRALRPRHLRQPLDADRRRRRGDRRAQDPRQGEEDRRAPARGQRGRPRLGAGEVLREGRAAESRRPSRKSRLRPTPIIRRGWRPGSKRSTTTIRRTSPSRSAATSPSSTSIAAPAR